jgi:hypothetical protein
MRGLGIAGEVGIGAAQGYGDFAWDATRELVLTWATGGLYQAIHGYHFYSGLYAGYRDGGALGALSVLNPFAAVLTPAEDATHAAVKGDYRAAGREGIKSLIAAVVTVVTVAIVPKPTGGKPPAGGGAGASGGPSASTPTGQVSVPRNAHLAGKTHPNTGIPFDKNGYPDFSKVVKVEVKIEPTGTRRGDSNAANKTAGFPKTPDNYTWHHHQDRGRMQLGAVQN